jgi:hypothetical protein
MGARPSSQSPASIRTTTSSVPGLAVDRHDIGALPQPQRRKQTRSATKSEYLDEGCDVLCVTKQSTSIDFGIDFGADNRMSARDLYVPPDTLQGARL